MNVDSDIIRRFLGGDPVEGNQGLRELVAEGDAGEEALFSRPISFPRTVQARRRWLRYVATREATVRDRLVERMENQSRFKDGYTAGFLFAGFRRDYAGTDRLYGTIDGGLKNIFKEFDAVDNLRNLFLAYSHAAGDAASLWHFIKGNSFAWEKLLTFAFRGACASFARVNAGDDWAIEQFITHQIDDGELEMIGNAPNARITHKAVDGQELWMQANDVFIAWRRGEVADVILRDWAQHQHWRVRYFGAQIISSLGFQRTLTPVRQWLNREPLDQVRESLLHALERTESPAGADALLEHYEDKQEGGPYLARSVWRCTHQDRALRALQAVAGGTDTAASGAMVSMARMGSRDGEVSSALDSQDPYRRLNAALAVGYLNDKAQGSRLEAMLGEAASPLERMMVSAAMAMLGRPNGASSLHGELVAAASAPEYDKHLDVFFLHRYLQLAILDAFAACGSEGAELLKTWRAELEPLEPVPTPVKAEISQKTSSAPAQESVTTGPSRTVRAVGSGTAPPVPLNVFLSYSHRDEKMRDELGAHLASLVNDGLIKIWHDREIEAGDDWEGEINKEIAGADIVLLLVSARFIESPYCRKELKKALEQRGAGETVAIPIILKPCEWMSVFNSANYKLQALPRDNKPVSGGKWPNHDAAYTEIVKELRTKIE